MIIDRVKIEKSKNFEEGYEIDFFRGINVLTGSNEILDDGMPFLKDLYFHCKSGPDDYNSNSRDEGTVHFHRLDTADSYEIFNNCEVEIFLQDCCNRVRCFYMEGIKEFGYYIDQKKIKPGAIVFWNAPENFLHPENYSSLADKLLEVSRSGVQIFITTYNEILAMYLMLNKKEGDAVEFFSFYKENDKIKVDQNERFDLLLHNGLASEPVRLYEKQIEVGLGTD